MSETELFELLDLLVDDFPPLFVGRPAAGQHVPYDALPQEADVGSAGYPAAAVVVSAGVGQGGSGDQHGRQEEEKEAAEAVVVVCMQWCPPWHPDCTT